MEREVITTRNIYRVLSNGARLIMRPKGMRMKVTKYIESDIEVNGDENYKYV